jgi:hypothetical protein
MEFLKDKLVTLAALVAVIVTQVVPMFLIPGVMIILILMS